MTASLENAEQHPLWWIYEGQVFVPKVKDNFSQEFPFPNNKDRKSKAADLEEAYGITVKFKETAGYNSIIPSEIVSLLKAPTFTSIRSKK